MSNEKRQDTNRPVDQPTRPTTSTEDRKQQGTFDHRHDVSNTLPPPPNPNRGRGGGGQDKGK